MRKYKLLIFVFVLCNHVFSQDTIRPVLIESISNECELIFSHINQPCENKTLLNLEEKFRTAEKYLTSTLSKMVLRDSTTFYEKKKQELKDLEQQEPESKNDLVNWNIKKEKSYLLISVLRPSRSDSLFTKLLHSYYDLTPVAFMESEKLESFFYYKLWLSSMLTKRFGEESEDYSKLRERTYYNRVVELTQRPFINIDSEKMLLKQLEEFVLISTANYKIEKEYKDLMSHVYVLRASRGTRKHNENRNDSLFQFLESVYLKAWDLAPERYMTNKNFGIFYYNEGASTIQSIPEDAKREEIEKLQNRALLLFKKAEPLMNKAEKLSMEKTNSIINPKKE